MQSLTNDYNYTACPNPSFTRNTCALCYNYTRATARMRRLTRWSYPFLIALPIWLISVILITFTLLPALTPPTQALTCLLMGLTMIPIATPIFTLGILAGITGHRLDCLIPRFRALLDTDPDPDDDDDPD
jgi:hypothetical protein